MKSLFPEVVVVQRMDIDKQWDEFEHEIELLREKI